MKHRRKLHKIYDRMRVHFGAQHWWPARTAFEVAVGAILTQNTSWQNVERAIDNLKKARCLSFSALFRLPQARLARLIRPAGYYNVKAKRLRNFLIFLKARYGGSLVRMRRQNVAFLRQELLAVSGIGPETADSILLYALGKPVFVVDAYTRRIFSRHRWVSADADYVRLQRLFSENLEADAAFFNEYHALLVRLGKEFCKKSKPLCRACPIYEKA